MLEIQCRQMVIKYTMRHQIYVSVYSCTVHDEASYICASILLYSTQWNIWNMNQYLVVQYTMKHQKYIPLSSCKVHEASEIYASK
jgi:hypothetical protein